MKITIKGHPGEGKTTVAALIASLLAERGYHVEIAEAEEQAIREAKFDTEWRSDPGKIVQIKTKTKSMD